MINVPSTSMGSSLATSGFFTSPEKRKPALVRRESGPPLKVCLRTNGFLIKWCTVDKLLGYLWKTVSEVGTVWWLLPRTRDNQDSDYMANNRLKKKGTRELEGLRTTVKYDKGRTHTKSSGRFIRGNKRTPGVMPSYK